MIKYRTNINGIKIAEILPESDLITSPDDILGIMADVGYNGSDKLIIHYKNLHHDFFDLKTGLAGEILQKFSNYRMRLAIIGDFSEFKSKSLKDFIRESNNRGIISFVDSLEQALSRLDR
jgi:hypothetical protein